MFIGMISSLGCQVGSISRLAIFVTLCQKGTSALQASPPLDEQFDTNVKEFRQLSCVRLADGTLSMKHFGSNSLRSEKLPKVLLRQVSRFHQVFESLPGACLPNRITALLVLVNQHGQEFSEFAFLQGRTLTFVQAFQLFGQALAFFVRTND